MLASMKGTNSMQPYQHVSAKGLGGVMTLGTKKCDQNFIVLGSSCPKTVNHLDGPVCSVGLHPRRENEVVALAVIEIENEKPKIVEALLLQITLKDGKTHVDLDTPWAGFAGAMGQLIVRSGTHCSMRLIDREGKISHSPTWTFDAKSVVANDPTATLLQESGFDAFCEAMVKEDPTPATAPEPSHHHN